VRRCVTDPRRPQVPDNDSVKHRPMLVTSGPLRPDNDRYAFEVKWDGLIRRSTVLAPLRALSVSRKAPE
jgi:hypothetical protein